MKPSNWHRASILALASGVALLVDPVSLVSYYGYPILAWGLLGILDALSIRRWNASLMRANPKWFWGIVVPGSVLFWLFFEFLNLLWPQWRYLYAPPNHVAAAILSFLSYSTVIPLVMEVFWLLHGPDDLLGLTPRWKAIMARNGWAFPTFGIALLMLFLLDRSFVTVQVMWCVPFVLFLPFLPAREGPPPAHSSKIRGLRAIPAIILAAFLSGLIWETGNYWARTKWDYLLLRDAPHLFQMPLAGYLGYIPFAFSVLVVYLWLRAHVEFTYLRAIAFYALALLACFVFIALYFGKFPP